jgi:serine/threonine kinase PknH
VRLQGSTSRDPPRLQCDVDHLEIQRTDRRDVGLYDARLLSLLPPGYVAGVCTPATAESGTIWTAATVMVTCGQNSQPGGPSKATYGIFPTPDMLKTAFKDNIANISQVNCPGEGKSPVSWHYDENPP